MCRAVLTSERSAPAIPLRTIIDEDAVGNVQIANDVNGSGAVCCGIAGELAADHTAGLIVKPLALIVSPVSRQYC